MDQVFSRWPSLAPTNGSDDRASLRDLPRWMLASPPRRWPGLGRDLATAGLVVAAPAILAVLAGWDVIARADATAPVAGLVACGAMILACAQVLSLRRRLEASEDRFSAIFERAGISMWREDWTAAGEAVAALRRAGVTDIEGYYATRPEELRALCAKVVVKDVNTFTLEETGAADKSAYLGPLDRLLPPTDQTFVQWLVAFGRGDRYFRSEAHITRANGEQSDTLFTAMLPRDLAGFSEILVTSLDITAFKTAQARLAAAEAELAHTSRIAAIGALGASIAHEVNTPLAAVVANAQAALRWLGRPDPDVREAMAALSDVVSEATRARDVVVRTRAIIGKAPFDLAEIDLVGVAREANLFVEREVRAHGATVHLAAESDIPKVTGDVVQIQQVFVNLLVNAAQAMDRSAGRRDITVAIRRREDAVCVTVSDTGPGIAADERLSVFEPFRSSKPGGMGLGLAICRNCIDVHGGDIWVEDAPSGGAAFSFTLPATGMNDA